MVGRQSAGRKSESFLSCSGCLKDEGYTFAIDETVAMQELKDAPALSQFGFLSGCFCSYLGEGGVSKTVDYKSLQKLLLMAEAPERLEGGFSFSGWLGSKRPGQFRRCVAKAVEASSLGKTHPEF